MKNEVRGACGPYGGRERSIQGAGGETRGEETTGETKANIRMDLQEVGLGYDNWIGVAQDRDRWRALVSVVRNLRVP